MKSNNRFIASVAILTAAMISAAGAAVSYTQGDLLLGFRATSGTGSATNYVVNLGSSSLYTGATGTSNVNVGNIAADLSAIYGADWYTQVGTNVTWGVIGSASNLFNVGSDPAATVYYTNSGSALTLINNSQKIASGAIVAFENGTSGAAFSTTFNSTNLTSAFASVIASGNAASWSSNLNNGSTTTIDFKLFPDIEGSPSTVLNLYRDGSVTGAANTSQLLGSFSLGSDGTLSFTAAAVPEPSAALLGGLGTLALLTRRRRKA